jgi:GDPmannose 4,6-dehydratase
MITGITGQDGHYLADLLLKKHYFVIGLASSSRTKKEPEPFFDEPNFKMLYTDFNDSDVIARILDEWLPDEFYNLAAASSVHFSFEHPLETAQINAMLPVRILELLRSNMKLKETKFYQASSSEMFGDGNSPRKTEQSRFMPLSPYATSKLFAHQSCKLYRDAYGIFASSGILFNHESPIRRENFVSRKISKGVARIAVGKETKIKLGTITPVRDWGFAGDYVYAMWLMLQNEEPNDFVIATGKPHSVLEFVEVALRVAGLVGDPLSYVELDPSFARPLDINETWGDSTKAQSLLGWSPGITFNSLINMMVTRDLEIESSTPSPKSTFHD